MIGWKCCGSSDSGTSDSDRITNDVVVNVNGLESSSSWQYSVDGGATWKEGPQLTREHLNCVIWDGAAWVAVGGGFAVDEAGQRIVCQDEPLSLTPVEFRLLRHLLQHPGRVFERAQLLDLIHEDFRDVSDRAVDSHIKNIRRKLAGVGAPAAGGASIVSVYGVGYRLELT